MVFTSPKVGCAKLPSIRGQDANFSGSHINSFQKLASDFMIWSQDDHCSRAPVHIQHAACKSTASYIWLLEQGNHARHCYLPFSRTAHHCPIYSTALAGDVLTVLYDSPAQMQQFLAGGRMPPGNACHAHFANACDSALHMSESEAAIQYKAYQPSSTPLRSSDFQLCRFRFLQPSDSSQVQQRRQACASKALL